MSDFYILNGEGEPEQVEDVLTWARFMESFRATGALHVGDTTVGDVRVSTVFLGLDHAFAGGPPLLYETMVFGGPLNGEQERYHTRLDAELGHAAMVILVREGMT